MDTFTLYFFTEASASWIVLSEHYSLDEAYVALADEQAEDKEFGESYLYRITEGRTIYEGS